MKGRDKEGGKEREEGEGLRYIKENGKRKRQRQSDEWGIR